MAIKAEDIFD